MQLMIGEHEDALLVRAVRVRVAVADSGLIWGGSIHSHIGQCVVSSVWNPFGHHFLQVRT